MAYELPLPPEQMPWLDHYGVVAKHIDYPEDTLYEAVAKTSLSNPGRIAYEFMGAKRTAGDFMKEIDHLALCFKKLGMQQGDHVMICMPNCPQGVIALYAVNKIGGVAVMVHPLSAKGEIEFYLDNSDSKFAITLDMFYPNFPEIKPDSKLKTLIVSSMTDALSPFKGFMYKHFLGGRKDPKVDRNKEGIVIWADMIKMDVTGMEEPKSTRTCYDDAVMLYTGGTTGLNKGAMLSSMNFTATTLGMGELSQVLKTGNLMIAVMPIFHGFGLCACVHAAFVFGFTTVLVPRFTPDSYAKMIVKKRPSFVAGVPTLYEHMLRSKWLKDADLSCLTGIFCGGDSLPVESKMRIDKFLKEHNCSVPIREGFGCTECVAATTITPEDDYRPGTVGIPMPDVIYKIVVPGTEERMPYGEDGEICISAPEVMNGYYNNPEETANVLRKHSDGLTWLHTGDLGCMDSDGFIYFKQRLKRMIVTSGYNVYPSQIENILATHSDVQASCVIGVPDEIRGSKIWAFVVPNEGVPRDEETIKKLKAHCRENIARYAVPREYRFIDALPKTKINKIDYRSLERAAEEELRAAAEKKE